MALLLSDHAWLWARGYDDGGPYLDLLRRLAHWLMKEPALEEEALRASAAGRAIRVERQTMKDVADRVTLTNPSGAQSDIALARRSPACSPPRSIRRSSGFIPCGRAISSRSSASARPILGN